MHRVMYCLGNRWHHFHHRSWGDYYFRRCFLFYFLFWLFNNILHLSRRRVFIHCYLTLNECMRCAHLKCNILPRMFWVRDYCATDKCEGLTAKCASSEARNWLSTADSVGILISIHVFCARLHHACFTYIT